MHLTAFGKTNYNAHNKRLFSFFKSKTFLVMKLTTLFLFAACMQLSAAGYGQKISISGENITLKKAFSEIEKQSGYSFFIQISIWQTLKKYRLMRRMLTCSGF